jgi:threonyl-tRNA synthetase
VQAIVLPVSDRHSEYAGQVLAELREAGVRVEADDRSESVGKKIRDAELGRYPYMLVVGDREQEAGALAVRSHEEGELGAMPVAAFAERVRSVYTPDT